MRNPDRGGAGSGTIGCALAKTEFRSAKTASNSDAIPYVALDNNSETFRKANRKDLDNTEQLFKTRRLRGCDP
jgi:hypothetical protein